MDNKPDKVIKVNVDKILREYSGHRMGMMKWICESNVGTVDQIVKAVSDIRAVTKLINQLEVMKKNGWYNKRYNCIF